MICGAVQNLIDYGIRTNLISKVDELVIRNEIMDILNLTDWKNPKSVMKVIRLTKYLKNWLHMLASKELLLTRSIQEIYLTQS